jgi:DNA replication protein DnaC
LLGETGKGKTVSVVALMHRILDRASEAGISIVDYDWAKRMRFMSAPSLATARRNCALGEEAPLVIEAIMASLLVLDEVGFEVFDPTRDTTLFEVLDARYLENKPTIVTSGRTEEEFRARYGAALMRRITDRGMVVNLWENA